MWVETLAFYIFSISLIAFAVMVVAARNPVHSVLFLVFCFFASAGLWILLEAEFLALILVLVYVGAVMTLFLFVVMMLNLDIAPRRESFVRYLPVGILIIALVIGAMVYVVGPEYFNLNNFPIPAHEAANYSNVRELGNILYTNYVYPFELAAVLLLIAIIAAITLSLRKSRAKKQDIPEQVRTNKSDRLSVVKMKSEELQRGLR